MVSLLTSPLISLLLAIHISQHRIKIINKHIMVLLHIMFPPNKTYKGEIETQTTHSQSFSNDLGLPSNSPIPLKTPTNVGTLS